MPGIDFDPSAEPTRFIYERLADHIAQLIERGQLLPDQPLPAERQLVAECGVSLGTVRHATRLLRDRGLVIIVRSKGVYVARRHGDAGRAMTDQDQTGNHETSASE